MRLRRHLVLASLLLGSACAPRAILERQDPPVITVIATWEAASAAKVAQQLAPPLEAELRALPGVRRIVTRCDDKGCVIHLQVADPGRAMEAAFQAGAAVRRAEPKLPRGAHAVAYAADTQRAPDLVIAFILDAPEVLPEHYGPAAQFAHNLMQLPDTARYEIPGMPETRTYVEVDKDRAKAMGVDPADVLAAIESQVVAVDEHTRVILGDRPGPPGDVSRIFIKRTGQPPVALTSVAQVRKVTTPGAVYRVDGEPAILVNVYLRSGATDDGVQTCLRRLLGERAPAPIKRVIPIRVRTR